AAYLGTVQNFYQLYIDTLMQMSRSSNDNYAAEALKVNEMARARSLLDLIVESRFDYRQGVPAELIQSKDRLQHQIDAKSEQLTILKNKGGNHILAETIGKEITALDYDLQQVESRIRQKSPTYAALTQPQPLDLAAIQQQVIEDEN